MHRLAPLALAALISGPALADDRIDTFRAQAMRGSYQGQRNVAYCLRTAECVGISIPKPIEACAWRIVILGSGDREVDRSDIANHQLECVTRIAPQERAVARQQAEKLFRQIYRKPLPPDVAG